MNERYHKMIADKLLQNQLKMIRNIENPTMFHNEIESLKHLHDDVIYGGARPTKYIQTGNNVASFSPSTLSTGNDVTETTPMHLMKAGKLRKSGRVKHAGSLFDDIGNVVKTVAPIAIPLMMSGLGMEKKKRGRPKKIVQAQPSLTSEQVVQQMPRGSGLRKTKRSSKGAASSRPGLQGGNFLDTLKSIGNYIKPVAETVGKDVILPVAMDYGKDALKSYLTKGKGLSGGKVSARGLIVKKVMKEKGLSLPQASKYVKENNLY